MSAAARSTAVTVWDIAKWPVLLIIIGLILAILFWASPNVRHGFQWVSPGGLITIVLWLAASALFAVYIANFSHYNKIYGSLAGVIIFLIWMWISPRRHDQSAGAASASVRPAPGMYPQMGLVAGLAGSRRTSSEPRGAVCHQMQSWC